MSTVVISQALKDHLAKRNASFVAIDIIDCVT